MKEIVTVKLENEMDLILAHKRAMKLCEMTGYSLIVQTSIATAISEIARCAIEYGREAVLALGIEAMGAKKFFKAVIRDKTDFSLRCTEACSFAKRLVDDIEIVRNSKEITITLQQQLSFSGTLSEAKIESFANYFKTEPPLSAYDEIRRKNLQLQELAEKLRQSEDDYRFLTDTLPLMMFSANNRGVISYSNKWLQDYFGFVPKELNQATWQVVVHPQDYPSFGKDLAYAVAKNTSFNGQYRFRQKSTGNYLWHIITVIPLKNDKEIVNRWIGFIVDISAQKQVDQTLKDNRELKEIQQQLFENQSELQQKVIELNRSNYELEQFAHLASHDLQEPLRKLFFYTDVLKKKYNANLDTSGHAMLNNMTLAASRMKELISDLLNYSQLQQQKLKFETVDLNQTMSEIVKDLDIIIREKKATVNIGNLPVLNGNPLRLRQLFTNLISNALKYSKHDTPPIIDVSASEEDENIVIKIKDNGIGFEEQYREKIFGLFERLHTRDQFPGTGIGLSICKRIVELHNGTIEADSVPNEYAIFSVTLPLSNTVDVLIEE
ncbi:MAG TPA: ATP-binding protein [Chryseosolibacter sp.]